MLPLARLNALGAARVPLNSTFLSSRSFLSRLLSTLAILEQREGKLNGSSLGAVAAAQKLGGTVHGLVAGPTAVAEEVAKVKGLEKVLMVDNPAYDKVLYCILETGSSWADGRGDADCFPTQGLPENFAPLVVDNIKKGGYTHVIAGHSAFGKNLLPRVAALLDVQQISDVMAIESEDSMIALPNC